MSTTTKEATIKRIHRLPLSKNGNPRFRITVDAETGVRYHDTAADIAVSYAVGNAGLRVNDKVTLNAQQSWLDCGHGAGMTLSLHPTVDDSIVVDMLAAGSGHGRTVVEDVANYFAQEDDYNFASDGDGSGVAVCQCSDDDTLTTLVLATLVDRFSGWRNQYNEYRWGEATEQDTADAIAAWIDVQALAVQWDNAGFVDVTEYTGDYATNEAEAFRDAWQADNHPYDCDCDECDPCDEDDNVPAANPYAGPGGLLDEIRSAEAQIGEC